MVKIGEENGSGNLVEIVMKIVEKNGCDNRAEIVVSRIAAAIWWRLW